MSVTSTATSTCGQRALYQVGMTGIPIINVNNNCSTGSTALFLARQAIESGALDCVLALGFEQMKPGALGRGLHRPAERVRRVRRGRRQAGRCPRRAAGAALFRRRRPQPHEEIRHAADVVRQGPRQGEPACQEQSAGAVPQGGHRRRRHERSGDLAGRDDAADGLSADLRRRGRGAGFGEVRRASTACARTSGSPRRP